MVNFDKRLQLDTVDEHSVKVIGGTGSLTLSTRITVDNDAVQKIEVTYNDINQAATLSGEFKVGLVYEVTVRGESPNMIVDIDGLALDGNSDPNHTPGGNFKSRFRIKEISTSTVVPK